MATKPNEYERLPASSLWLGSDHLLHVRSRWFAEEYHRFYLRDIQAVALREKQGLGLLLETVLVIALAIMAGSALTVYWLAIPAGLAVAVYVIHKWRGPQCVFSVRTATGDWKIQSLGRMRVARQAVAAIRARVEAVQGVVDADSRFERGAVPQWIAPPPPRDLRSGRGWYVGLFSAALSSAAFGIAAVAYPRVTSLTTPVVVSNVFAVLLAMIGLARGGDREGVGYHGALVILLLETAKYCFVLTRFFSLPFELLRGPGFHWELVGLSFEILVGVTAMVAWIEMRGGSAGRKTARL